jgi:hypothetical protein
MPKITEIIIQASLRPNQGWQLTRLDLQDGVELDRSAATDSLFPSAAAARAWVERNATYKFLMEHRGVSVRFERGRDPVPAR